MTNTALVEKSDKEILELTLQDRRFFSQFYKKYFKKIYTYCLTKNNYNSEVTQDIVSTVFLKALEKIETVKLDEKYNYSILPWLYTIARNTVLNHWASSKNKDSNLSYNDDIDSDEGSISSNLISRDSVEKTVEFEIHSDKLKASINKLDELSKDIVWKRIYDELQFNEIAQLLDMQEAAVKMRYYRAIESVTKMVKDC